MLNNTREEMSSASYSSILTALSGARADLERSTSRINVLESENSTLQTNYAVIKAELLETKKRMNESRENYMKLSEEKIEREKQSEIFMERLKAQLVEKSTEFELLRDKFAPQDMEFIRIKLQEELEIPHKVKVQMLVDELEICRDSCNQLKRELERCKAEFSSSTENQKREISALRGEHDSVVASLHNQVISLEEREYLPEKENQIRLLKSRVLEQQAIIDASRQEIRLLTQDRDNLSLKTIEIQSKFEEAASRNKSKIVIAESERHAAEQKLSISLLDFDKKEALLRSLKHSVEELASELERANKLTHELEVKLGDSQADSSRHLLDLQQLFENERREHNFEIDRLNGRLNEREEILRRAQREAAEMQLRAESIEADVRRSYQNQLQELTKKYAVLEASMLGDRTGMQLTEMQKLQYREKLEVELDQLRSDSQQMRREKDAAQQSYLEMEYQLEQEQQKYSKYHRTTTTTIANLQNELTSNKTTIAELESKLFGEAIVDRDMKLRLDALEDTTRADQIEKASLTTSLREAAKQLRSLDQQWNTKLESMRDNCKNALAKERKKAEAYKLKALESHKKWKDAATIAAAAACGERRHEYPVVIMGGNNIPAAPAPAPPSSSASSATVTAVSEKLSLKMEAQIESWERKCQAFDLELGKARIREEDLSATITRLRAELAAVQDQRQRANDRVSDLEGVKKTQASQIINLEVSLRKESERALELDNAKSTYRTQTTQLENSLRHHSEKITELENTRKQLQMTVDTLEAASRRDNERIQDLENSKKSLQSQLVSTETNVRRESDRASDLDASKKSLLTQISSLEYSYRREAEKVQDAENSRKTLYSQVQSLEQNLRTETEQRTNAQANERMLREELDRLRIRTSENNGLLQMYQQQQKQSHIALLEQETLKRRPAELEQELSLAKAENDMLQKRIADATTEITAIRTKNVETQRLHLIEIDVNKTEIAKLQRRCDDATEEILGLKSKLVDLSNKPDYERELHSSRHENVTLAKRISDLEKELESKVHQLQLLTQTRDDLERIRNRNNELESLRIHSETLRDDYEHKRASIETELTRLRMENGDLRRQLKDVTPELLLLRNQMGALEDAVIHDSSEHVLPSRRFDSNISNINLLRRSQQRL